MNTAPDPGDSGRIVLCKLLPQCIDRYADTLAIKQRNFRLNRVQNALAKYFIVLEDSPPLSQRKARAHEAVWAPPRQGVRQSGPCHLCS